MLMTLFAVASAVSLSAGRAFAQVSLPSAAPIITSGNLFTALGNLVSTVLLWAGILAFFYALYGGFLYLTAGPDQNKADGGRKTIINAVIGIMIIALSYVFVEYITGDALRGGNQSRTTTSNNSSSTTTTGGKTKKAPTVKTPAGGKASLVGIVDTTKSVSDIDLVFDSSDPLVADKTVDVDSSFGYSVENVDPGFYTVTIKAGGVECGKATVSILEGKITTKDMSCD
jgi:hypothetical protein